ncbi:MAG: transposase [Thermotogota bacterium]
MHKPNEAHRQKRLFSFLNLLPKGMRARIENSIFPLFYEEVFCKIDEQVFAPLYSEKASRPNCPVNILVGLEILKHLFNLSDKQLFDTYARDIGYKLALGLQELAEGDISLRTLYNFRNRVVAYDQEYGVDLMLAVFETLTARFIEKAGVSTDIIRMDSTQITSNMKRMSRIDIMSRTLQQFLKGLDKDEIALYQQNYGHYIDEDERKAYLESIAEPSQALEVIAQEMLEVLTRYQNHPDYSQRAAYHLLERVLNDQTVIVENQLQVKTGKEIASDSCQSPFDPDATYIRKNGKGYSGYSTNITETADPDNETQMITHVHTEPNIHSDKAFLNEELDALKEKTDMTMLIVDGGYAGEEMREKVNEKGVEFIETGLKGQAPKYNSAGFDIDETRGILRCPMGKEPIRTWMKKEKAHALFSHEDCTGCPNADKCFAKKQKKAMKVDIDLKRYERDKRRAYMQTEAFREKKNLRPAIEGTISAMKRTGLNSIRVCGLFRVRMTVIFNAIGCNLKRLHCVCQNKRKSRNKQPLLLNHAA